MYFHSSGHKPVELRVDEKVCVFPIYFFRVLNNTMKFAF